MGRFDSAHAYKSITNPMNTKSKSFLDWLASDNVVRLKRNLYTTHDSQYRNRLTKEQALEYFIKEYK